VGSRAPCKAIAVSKKAFTQSPALKAGMAVLLLSGWNTPCAAAAGAMPEAHGAGRQGMALELTEENDFFAGADRHYTQGIRINFISADNCIPGWSRRGIGLIPAPGFRVDAIRTGLELGQSLYTPSDTSVEEPILDDRPYAGWLYGGAIIQRRGVTRGLSVPVLETMRIQLGIIGPGAMAGQTQDIIHFELQCNRPKGWHNQLHNEPGLALKYQRAWRWRLRRQRGWNADLIPNAGMSVGNTDTSLRAGVTARFGWRLPDDFGIQTIDSPGITGGGRPGFSHPGAWGFYGFIGTEGKAVIYTAFLDGNLFESSQSVDKRLLVAEFKSGLALVLSAADVAMTYSIRTEEFYGQESFDTFGSVSVKLKF